MYPEKILKNSTSQIPKNTIVNIENTLKPFYLINHYLNNDICNQLLLFVNNRNNFRLFQQTLPFWNNFLSKTLKKDKINLNYIFPGNNHDNNLLNNSKSISNLVQQKKGIYLFSINILEEDYCTLGEYSKNIIKLSSKQTISTNQLLPSLIKTGYKTDNHNLEEGFFYMKGDTIFVYPINHQNPLKIELFGNNIEAIRSFDLKDKKTINSLENLTIYPIKFTSDENKNTYPILDYLEKNNSLLCLDNPEDFKNVIDFDYRNILFQFNDIAEKHPRITFDNFANNKDSFRSNLKNIIIPKNNLREFKKFISKKQNNNYKINLFTSLIPQFKKILNNQNISFIERDGINYENNNFLSNFEDHNDKTLFIFDHNILNENYKTNKRKRVDKTFISELQDNDYVVHLDHGIGIFKGITKRTIDEGEREFLIIEYAKGDKLFLPAEYTDKISKYVGANKPKINRLHEASWHELKTKIKEDAQKQAQELLQIYASRENSSGFIYSPDTPNQNILEEAFKYQETPDQLKVIQEIKEDMEGHNIFTKKLGIKKPMDRLVCGDVGFGKTEIAVRASFKAIQDHKQVAILCPTTLLAEQHFETFSKRLNKFSCHVDRLSRFKSKSEQKKIISKLSSGSIDIIIGTHRLLSRDIKFNDLGLLIIDEEQRFGVKHKERLKKLRPKVDILTLSATPIPRTLNLALSQLKNISILETPPEGRKAVETSILPYSDNKIIKAIGSELKRGGQVYYLHNRVATIDAQLKRLSKLIPKARFGIIHGQLSEKAISDIMQKFNKEKKIDVLICSSIIENGLDLPNVNTLIVDNAVMFGLADLHQLRGRIGRSTRKAHAYFFYKSQKLSPKARQRLEALLSAKDLGAGFQIAMRDLEIRGAGNILGKQQSGSIKSIGLNLYCQLLNQAVNEIKTGKVEELALHITIDLPISGYISEKLINNPQKRIRLYQKLSKIHSIEELKNEEKILRSKYKNINSEFNNLFKILELKILAKNANIKNIDTKKIIKYGDNIYRLTLEFNKIPPYKKIRKLIDKKIDLSIDNSFLKIDTENLNKENLINLLRKILIGLK